MRKKNGYVFFFGVPVAEKRIYIYIYIFMCEKRKKKRRKKGAENGLGYCPTVSQYNGKLYCDTTGLGHAVWARALGHNTVIVL